MAWSRRHFFSGTLVALLVIVAFVSYARFMVWGDYVVAYEGNCDPYTQSCFIGCEDDECTEEYYYSQIQKYAPNIEAQCGPDITDCDAAYECRPEDGDHCEVTYCEPTMDGEDACETLTEADMEKEEETLDEEVEDMNEEMNEIGDENDDGEELEAVNEEVIIEMSTNE